MKKRYRIRPNSPMDHIVNALPTIGLIALFVACCMAAGIMNSWELGLL